MSGRKQFAVEDALDRAVRVFWHKGYAGATIADLVEGTGLGRGSLYGTFGDKATLFRACLGRYAETVAADLVDALRSHPELPHAALRAMYETILARMADPTQPPGCLIALTASDACTLDADTQCLVRAQLDGQRAAIEELLRHGQLAGEIPAGADPRVLAEHQVAVAQSLALLHRAGADPTALRGVVDVALGTLGRAGGPGRSEPDA